MQQQQQQQQQKREREREREKIVNKPDKVKYMCISLESSNHKDLKLMFYSSREGYPDKKFWIC
jgi:hypothetical protein